MVVFSQYVPRVPYMLRGWRLGISEPSRVAPSLQNVTWLHKKNILKYLERPIKITLKITWRTKKNNQPFPPKKQQEKTPNTSKATFNKKEGFSVCNLRPVSETSGTTASSFASRCGGLVTCTTGQFYSQHHRSDRHLIFGGLTGGLVGVFWKFSEVFVWLLRGFFEIGGLVGFFRESFVGFFQPHT